MAIQGPSRVREQCHDDLRRKADTSLLTAQTDGKQRCGNLTTCDTETNELLEDAG